MLERLIFKIEFDIGVTISRFHNSEKHFHCSLRNWLHVLGLAEFDFIAPDSAHLIHEEHLVDVDLAPLVNNVLNDLLAFELAHI
jgi:hypothetical protein